MTTAGPHRHPDDATLLRLLDASPDAVVAVDGAFNVSLWNAAAERLYGFSANEACGGPPPHLPAGELQAWQARVAGDDPAPLPTAHIRRHKLGADVLCSVEAEVVWRQADGTLVAARFERELRPEPRQRQGRNRYSQALAEAADEASVVEQLGRVVRDLLGSRTAVVLAPADEPVDRLEVRFAMGAPVESVGPVRWNGDNGSLPSTAGTLTIGGQDVPAVFAPMGPPEADWWVAVAYPDGVPHIAGLAALAQALAGEAWVALMRTRLISQLQEQIDALEAQTRVRADYVAGITHDLRTPLTGLLGFVRTLRHTIDDSTPEERREYLEVMERQATRLAGMVEDMLTGVRLETGQLRPDAVTDVDVATLLGDALVAFDPEQRTRIGVETEAGLVVRGDRRLLQRVVQNLLSNALTYSEGPVEVRAGRDETDGGQQIVVAFCDHGPGIDDEMRARLFSRFERGHGLRRGSTGLGLYIVAGIVASHGGTVDVETSPDRGSVFTVRLPSGGARRAASAP